MSEKLLRLLSDVSEDTAVYIKHVTVHEVRSIRGKEYNRSHKVLRVTPAFCRSLRNDE